MPRRHPQKAHQRSQHFSFHGRCSVEQKGELASAHRHEVRAYTLTFVNARSHNQRHMLIPVKLLGVADLAERWHYTRQGIHQFARRAEFPAPVAVVNLGRTQLWAVADIEIFERTRPELQSENAKKQKQTGYYLARLKGAGDSHGD